MPDERTTGKLIVDKYGRNVVAMADYLVTISASSPGVVYWVFQHLDHTLAYGLACRFVQRASFPINSLHVLSESKDGIVAANVILWNLKNRQPQLIALSSCNASPQDIFRLEQLIANVRPNGTSSATSNSQPRQLSQAEIHFFIERGQNQKLWMKRGRLVTRKLYDPAICWDLPDKGVGFNAYNIDDLKGKNGDKYGYDQIGTKETIDAMMRIAKEWYALHPDRLLQYGDISRPGGINTPDHGGHTNGKIFDVRPLRNDTKLEKLTLDNRGYHPHYDRELTKDCFQLIARLYAVKIIYFNDPVVLGDPKFKSFVKSSDVTHYNHFHVELQ